MTKKSEAGIEDQTKFQTADDVKKQREETAKAQAKKQSSEMSEGENASLEITTNQAKNEALPKKKYKLDNPDTSYAEKDFTLTGDQEKELPEFPSTDLIARIRSGFIVEA